MSVWVTVPSKRPPAEVKKWAQAWRDMGYKIAIYRDHVGEQVPFPPASYVDILIIGTDYQGYARTTNRLIWDVMQRPDTRFAVIGGDDVFPDTTKRADEIAQECEDHFGTIANPCVRGTFGVMQCTGDKWGDKQGPYIERVAGSAWIGREFALRVYGGNGPLWPEYWHMYPDEELQLVAQKLGVFWQRPDLTQIHQHWGRPKEGETMGHSHNMPAFLKRANSDKEWDAAKKLFEARKAAGFPGHEVTA